MAYSEHTLLPSRLRLGLEFQAQFPLRRHATQFGPVRFASNQVYSDDSRDVEVEYRACHGPDAGAEE